MGRIFLVPKNKDGEPHGLAIPVWECQSTLKGIKPDQSGFDLLLNLRS